MTMKIKQDSKSVEPTTLVLKGKTMMNADVEMRPGYKRSDFIKLQRGKFFEEVTKSVPTQSVQPKD